MCGHVILLHFKTHKFIILFFFNLVIMLICYFIHHAYLYKLIFLNIFFSLIFSLEDIMQREYDNGNLDLLFLVLVPLEYIIFQKLIIHYSLYFLSLMLFFSLLVPTDIISVGPHIGDTLYLLLHGTLYLNALGFLGTTLLLGSKSRIFLLNIMLFPLFLPYVIWHEDLPMFLNLFSYIMLFITPLLVTHLLKKL